MGRRPRVARAPAVPLAFGSALGCMLLGCMLSGCCGNELTVRAPDGAERARYCVEEATAEEDRRRGLIGRASLGVDEGLLLVFPAEGSACISQAATQVDIDAIYADDDGLIHAIERDFRAGDATARCHDQTRYVLEIGAGRAGRVVVGDRLEL